MIIDGASGGEEGAYAIAEPEGREDVCHLLRVAIGYIAFGVHHRDARRKPVLPPHLENVADKLRLAEQIGPDDFAGRIRIVLEAHEREIRQAIASLEVVEESPQP